MAVSLKMHEEMRSLLSLIYRRLRPVWPYWLAGTVLTIGFSGFQVGIAGMQQNLLDLVVAGNLTLLYRLLVIWGGALALMGAAGCAGWYLINYGMALVVRSFRRETASHLNRIALPALEKGHTGDFVSRAFNDTAQAIRGFMANIAQFTSAVITALLAFYYLSRINFLLTLIVTAVGPLIFLVGRVFDRRLRRLGELIQKGEAEMRSFLQDDLQAMEVVRAYNLEEWAVDRFTQIRSDLKKLHLRQALVSNCLHIINYSSWLLCTLASGMVIALAAVRGNLSTGTVLAFLIMVNRLTGPFAQVSYMWGSMQHAFAAARRVKELLAMPVEYAIPVAAPLPSIAQEEQRGEEKHRGEEELEPPALLMEDVVFHHAGERRILDRLSLRVNKGEVVGLVGGSGAGKTTVARLALGLYLPDQGEVAVCGLNTKENLSSIRSLVAYVPQTPYLYADTVLENITCGEALALSPHDRQQLGLTGLAAQLPHELETRVGERGIQLSGGQRQRVALARALVRRPALIVLDEATSALDNETEKEIQHILLQNRGEAGILIIAHRLGTVAGADRILVLHEGKIVEEGEHGELLRRGGYYAHLWQAAESDIEETAAGKQAEMDEQTKVGTDTEVSAGVEG